MNEWDVTLTIYGTNCFLVASCMHAIVRLQLYTVTLRVGRFTLRVFPCENTVNQNLPPCGQNLFSCSWGYHKRTSKHGASSLGVTVYAWANENCESVGAKDPRGPGKLKKLPFARSQLFHSRVKSCWVAAPPCSESRTFRFIPPARSFPLRLFAVLTKCDGARSRISCAAANAESAACACCMLHERREGKSGVEAVASQMFATVEPAKQSSFLDAV